MRSTRRSLRSSGTNSSAALWTTRIGASVAVYDPFAKIATEPARLLVALWNDPAVPKRLAEIAATAPSQERFEVTARAAYLWCPEGISKSVVGEALLVRAGDGVTTRNVATLGKLLALARGG